MKKVKEKLLRSYGTDIRGELLDGIYKDVFPAGTPSLSPSDGWVKAKTYVIAPLSTWQKGSLDDQWSACNGVDTFGHKDPEIEKIRQQHGEVLDGLPGCPRLILFREQRNTPVAMKLWYTRTFQPEDNLHFVYASLAKAIIELGPSAARLSVEVIDWGGEASDGRYELSVELCGQYTGRAELLKMWRRFMGVFEKGSWE